MDGHPGLPDPGALWRFAAAAKADFVGTSPAFVGVCMKAGIEPAKIADLEPHALARLLGLAALRRRLPLDLPPVPAGVPRLSAAAAPTSPAASSAPARCCRSTKARCSAGCSASTSTRATSDGRPLADEVGEMMIGTPDAVDAARLLERPGGAALPRELFLDGAGEWRQGDWLRITPRGGAVVYGRSDATIKRHGVRMGTAELYRADRGGARGARLPGGRPGIPRPAFLHAAVRPAAPGVALDAALKARIAQAIRTAVSARFVPDDIFAVAEVPRTLTGKKMELPVRNLLLGRAARQGGEPRRHGQPGEPRLLRRLRRRAGRARRRAPRPAPPSP